MDPKGSNGAEEDQDSQTIACVSGFLINLVEKRIRLITLCNASDRWSFGSWVLDDALFYDVSHALEIIEQIIVKHIRETVHRDDHLRFRPDIKICNVQVHWCELSTRWINLTFKRSDFLIGRLCELIGKEGFTAKSVVMEFETEYGVSTTKNFEVLNLLLQHGVFENEPSSGLQDSDFQLANS